MSREAAAPPAPQEFAPGIYQLPVGHGPLRANIYFVRAAGAGAAWALIDTGMPGCGPEIRAGAEALFGTGARPMNILVTHAHPDHIGSAAELARHWDCPVYLHAEDVKMIGGELEHFWKHSFTLDRWVILPFFRLAGKKHIRAIMARDGLREYARALGEGAAADPAEGAPAGAARAAGAPDDGLPVPDLPDWQAIPVPGHTPGHVAFFRAKDRVLIAGDAVVTMGRALHRPPWFFTWNRGLAGQALGRLAALEPLVIAGGHGRPQEGAELATELRELAAGR